MLLGNSQTTVAPSPARSKVPEVTLGFWLVKIAATTLGETGGDAVSMSMQLGYLLSTGIFAAVFALAVAAQIRAKQFNAYLYWLTIIASTTVGTTLADFADRSLHIGYTGGVTLLATLLAISFICWRRNLGTVSVASVTTPQAETFYWCTIMLSQTLGTALGDWTADTQGLGYFSSIEIFGGLLAIIAALRFVRRIPSTWLFWAAFILTRPLGAVLGDFFDKPLAHGGLALSRYTASAVLFAFMLAVIFLTRPKAASTEQAH